MKILINTLTAELFLELYRSVGWEPPCKEQVERSLHNTLATFVVYDKEKAIGMVRLLGDGGMSFYVKDFAVLPDCQSQGIGKGLMNAVHKYVLSQIKEGWAVSLRRRR